jgi:hypothetical protein
MTASFSSRLFSSMSPRSRFESTLCDEKFLKNSEMYLSRRLARNLAMGHYTNKCGIALLNQNTQTDNFTHRARVACGRVTSPGRACRRAPACRTKTHPAAPRPRKPPSPPPPPARTCPKSPPRPVSNPPPPPITFTGFKSTALVTRCGTYAATRAATRGQFVSTDAPNAAAVARIASTDPKTLSRREN